MNITVNTKLCDWLIAHGCYPIKETSTSATFKRTPQLAALLDKYYIQTVCIRNKNK